MPRYDFSSLSWADFEELSRDLLQEELSLTLESFKAGRDKGIDLRHSKDPSGDLIVQCKHYAASGTEKLIRHLRSKEQPKVKKLQPKRYLLVTSAGLTPSNKDEIKGIFAPFVHTPQDIFGCDEVNNLLGKFPEVEKRHFKLWLNSEPILQRVLHSDVFVQSGFEEKEIRKTLKTYVQTKSFGKALNVLEDNKACIISGIPGIGKTTLAKILLVHYLSKGFELIKIRNDISEAQRTYKVDAKQVYYYDDFLGQTSLREKLNKNEDSGLINFIRHLEGSKSKRFILTTREYILQQARSVYEPLARADLDWYKLVVSLSDYSNFDKAKILLNHLEAACLSKPHIASLMQGRTYLKIIKHPNYNPRIIESMTDRARIRSVPPESYAEHFLQSLTSPSEIWSHAFEKQISTNAQEVLFVLASLPREVFLDDLRVAFEAFHQSVCDKYNRAHSSTDFQEALRELEGSFTITERIDKDFVVRFHNPSVRDYLESRLEKDDQVVRSLVVSCRFFEQLSGLWNLAPAGNRTYPIRRFIAQDVSSFVESAERSFLTQSCGLMTDWTPRERRALDVEDRLETIVRVCAEISDATHADALIRMTRIVLNRLAEGQGEKESLVALLEYLNGADKFGLKTEELIGTARSFFIGDLRSLDDFERFLEFREIVPNAVTDDDFDLATRTFSDVHFDDCYNEVWEANDPEQLEEYRTRLSSVGNALSVSTSVGEERISEKVSELEEQQARYEDHLYDEYREERAFKEQEERGTDTEIDRLFDTLRESAEQSE